MSRGSPLGQKTLVQTFVSFSFRSAARARNIRIMNPAHAGAAAATHLSDLQADIEAGCRTIDQIYHELSHVRGALVGHPQEVALVELSMKRVAELKACLMQQRALMRELRHDIRSLRDLTNR